ncbi:MULTISPECIES: DUF397 domain-containing protein [Streptomyces]|uniref:DUF397 domain-containing protein n=1 Tax=Streptomyces mordarskii TaxID=1226758 RepID=A0ABP3NWE3_9ACTN|nr:DUF397 domain-containing protein [Streptomyces sp. WAC05858]RSS45983.1 DUF397 domain-containing protein [Streptomyces sp. WAC05858]WTA83757.1 DUF397 domain-containing protein [Streptomyces antimycoticus]
MIRNASALLGVVWRKSTYSDSNGGTCVEVADGIRAVVPVRDSKDPNGPALIFPASCWSSFISAVKGGEFHSV